MNITRNVIADLYPLYAEQECSGDTRALVDEYLRLNPREASEFRKIMEAELPTSKAPAMSLEEVKSLKEARRRVRRRACVMGFAIFFSLAPFSVQVNGDSKVHWLFRESPVQAAIFAIVAVALWTLYVVMRRRSKSL